MNKQKDSTRLDLTNGDDIEKLRKRIKNSFIHIAKRSEGSDDCAQEIIARMLDGKHQHSTIDQAVIDYLRSSCNLKGFRRRVEGKSEPVAHSYEQGEFDRFITNDSGRDLGDRIDDHRERADLKSIIETMPDRTRDIMSLHIKDKTLVEIAESLEVSESRISQIVSRVTDKMAILGLVKNPISIAKVVKW